MPPECQKYLYVERHIISCRLLDHSPLKIQVFPPGLHDQIQWMHAFKIWIEKKLDIVVLCSARLSMRKCCIAWESRLQGRDLDAAEMRGPDTRYLCCSASGQPQVLLSAAHCAMWLSSDVQRSQHLTGRRRRCGWAAAESLHPPSPDHGHMFLHSRDTSLVIARGATQATSSYRGQAVKYPSNMLNISCEQCIAFTVNKIGGTMAPSE